MEAISFFDRGLAKAPFKKAPLINTLISLKLGVRESYIHGVFEANTKKKKRKEKKKKTRAREDCRPICAQGS